MPRLIDLFCGCGGISLGAHQAGYDVALSVDADETLSSSYRKNFPHADLVHCDLAKVAPSDLAREYNIHRPDGIVGGPPCQGFSVIGRRDESDSRNNLIGTFFDYVAYLKPKFFLMENVPGLGTIANRPLLERALDLVPSFYTVLEPKVYDAADFGSPTSRPRLLVIGYDPEYVDSFEVQALEAAKTKDKASVRDAIWDLPGPNQSSNTDLWRKYPKRRRPSEYALRLRTTPATQIGEEKALAKLRNGMANGFQPTQHAPDVIARFSAVEPGSRDRISKYQRLSWDRPSPVLRAGTGSDRGSYQAARPIHPDEPRVITVREAARIQGFPDWFQFHPTKWQSHRMIGNSVSPVFAEAILEVLLSKLATRRTSVAAE